MNILFNPIIDKIVYSIKIADKPIVIYDSHYADFYKISTSYIKCPNGNGHSKSD